MAATARKDYYATLGVPRDAKPDAIQRAHRHLVRKYHPDVNPGDKASEERYREIDEAYQVLKDKKKREFYDQFGFFSESAFRGAGPGGAGPRSGGFGFDGFDFAAQQATPGADFTSVFDAMFGGGRHHRPAETAPAVGEDIEYALDVDFKDAIRGSKARLSINRQKRCRPCGGSGAHHGAQPRICEGCRGTGQTLRAAGNMRFHVPCGQCGGQGRLRSPCPSCSGDGRVYGRDRIEVRIPPGTGENARLRVRGKGNAGVRGGKPGDLYIVAKIGEHPFFKRKGSDIKIQVPVTPAEAILGAKIELPTIDGKAFLRIPPATNSGTTFRVRGRGVTDPRTGQRGDQFVRISIVVPDITDENTKELMRQYAELNPGNPREDILREL